MTNSVNTLSVAAPNRLPANILDADAALPDFFVHANCGYTLEWYEVSQGYRTVALYRYTASGRFSWSVCLAVRPSEPHCSIVRRAKELRAEAA